MVSKIHPGQLRARPTSRAETLADLLRGIPRSTSELKCSLRLLGLYRQIGWQQSIKRGLPSDQSGGELPWLSYPALAWLDAAFQGAERVFEYGSGNSTLWFSRRASSVVSVEHDGAWVGQLRKRLPSNVTLLHRACGGDEDWAVGPDPYVEALATFSAGSFDLVVIDGMARNSCALVAIDQVDGDGLIVLDNADRPAHHPAIDALHAAGFGRIDFVGPTVVQGVFSSTSVFSRNLPSTLAVTHGYPTFWGY